MKPADLRACLLRLELTQVALARLTGQTPVTVARWLSGERGVPRWLDSWLAMYEALTKAQRKRIWQDAPKPLHAPLHTPS